MTPGSLFIGGPNWELAHISVDVLVDYKAQLIEEWLEGEMESFRRSIGQRPLPRRTAEASFA